MKSMTSVQRKTTSFSQVSATESIDGEQSNSTGIPTPVLGAMENVFGHDFSQVKVHSDSQRATELGALAYTQGHDIHMAPGRYRPETSEGRQLLGHELAHVVQQSQGTVPVTHRVNGAGINDDAGLEGEADFMGKRCARVSVSDSSSVSAETCALSVNSSIPSGSVAQLAPDWWTRHIYGPHRYSVSHRANTRRSGETDAALTARTAEAMRQNPAPGAMGREATPSPGNDIFLPIGRVNSEFDPQQNTVTNTTRRPHLLHPGAVVRTADREHIHTVGTGTGLFPSLNNSLAGPVWGSPAHHARSQTDPAYLERVERERERAYERSIS